MSDATPEPLAIRVDAVAKHFDGGLVEALRGVSFDVPRGQRLAIMGPSGSGKTTLLHLLAALDLPTHGRVEIMGQDLTEVSLDRLRNRTLGFVFQLHHLIPNLTLWENVALPTYPRGLARREQRERAADLLESVGLGHRIDFLPVKCSGGERQRAAVARALINDPEILLADEPTGSVDSKTGEKILDLFDRVNRERRVTTVVITHNREVADRADRVLHLVDGLLQVDSLAGEPSE